MSIGAEGVASAFTAGQANTTDLPNTLKAGIEHLSGDSIDDVQVHYKASSRPAVQRRQLDALFGPVIQRPGVTQRSLIPHGPIAGLAQDLDTSDYTASKQQIDALWNGGRVGSLSTLMQSLQASQATDTHPDNNKSLAGYIKTLLAKKASSDSNAGLSGSLAEIYFDYMNPASDQTGITQQPGHAEVLPVAPTPLQTNALAVRSWQIGDILDNVSWSTLGAHLQGRMTPADYIELGNIILGLRDAKNKTTLQSAANNMEKTQVATQSLNRVAGEVRGGLNGLPSLEGVSYRAATSAPSIYGSVINVGDYIKDMAFWSTSALRLSHLGHNFGEEGTRAKPKVYYIVTGSTGVFLPRFTNKEVGVREVLYKDKTIFRVNQITNYADRTVFVHVSETDPATLPPQQVTKNPWSGANNL